MERTYIDSGEEVLLKDLPPDEQKLELEWSKTLGVTENGKMWLTPRMERNAELMEKGILCKNNF